MLARRRTADEDLELLALLELEARRESQNLLSKYKPYPKQLEFHELAGIKTEAALIAANQVGKTWGVGMEIAMHLTGRYPDWWPGRRWNRPVVGIAGSKSGTLLRDGAQRILFGLPGEWGTGSIPKDAIVEEPKRASGTPDLIDSCVVRHVSGRNSRLSLKTYDMGRERWQADTLDFVWDDEEPPEDIYIEGLTRLNARDGQMFLTATPLLGMSRVISRYLQEPNPKRGHVTMTLDDAPHYTAEQRAAIIARYPEHEREARTLGMPSLGSGAVFPISIERVSYDAGEIQMPKHWPTIGGIDFGWDHPTAAAWLRWDRDADVVYVTDCYAESKQTPIIHAAAFRARNKWCPMAWPADGLQTEKGTGQQLATQYEAQGVNMLPSHATFEDGSVSVEAGVMEMLDRMQTGRLKVAKHLEAFWREFRMYHRKDGKIVKIGDDVLSAVRYALMELRNAQTPKLAVVNSSSGGRADSWMAS